MGYRREVVAYVAFQSLKPKGAVPTTLAYLSHDLVLEAAHEDTGPGRVHIA